jgi:hypothetical protein
MGRDQPVTSGLQSRDPAATGDDDRTQSIAAMRPCGSRERPSPALFRSRFCEV